MESVMNCNWYYEIKLNVELKKKKKKKKKKSQTIYIA